MRLFFYSFYPNKIMKKHKIIKRKRNCFNKPRNRVINNGTIRKIFRKFPKKYPYKYTYTRTGKILITNLTLLFENKNNNNKLQNLYPNLIYFMFSITFPNKWLSSVSKINAQKIRHVKRFRFLTLNVANQ